MTISRTAVALALALAAGLGSTQAAAQTRTLDISFSNLYSNAESGSDQNSAFTVQLVPQAYLRALSWTADLTAFEPSWLSEIALALTNSAGEGVLISPADGYNLAGHQAVSGSLDLVNNGLGFRLLADGQLQLSFVDTVDDLAGLPDGRWNSGTLHISFSAPVPEPAAAWMLMVGAAGLAGLGWRQRRQAAAAAH